MTTILLLREGEPMLSWRSEDRGLTQSVGFLGTLSSFLSFSLISFNSATLVNWSWYFLIDHSTAWCAKRALSKRHQRLYRWTRASVHDEQSIDPAPHAYGG